MREQDPTSHYEVWKGDSEGNCGMPVGRCDFDGSDTRSEWEDNWMDYKNFKMIIAEIEKEKRDKLEQLQKEKGTNEDIAIDISMIGYVV